MYNLENMDPYVLDEIRRINAYIVISDMEKDIYKRCGNPVKDLRKTYKDFWKMEYDI